MLTATKSLTTLSDLSSVLEHAEGFAPLLASLRDGHSGTVDGTWGSSAALVAATLSKHTAGTALVVIAHPRDVDGWAADLTSFAGVAPAVFPAWDNWPITDSVVDETAGQRLRLLKQLEGPNPPRVVLATIQALIQPVPARAQLAANRRRLRVGDTCDLEEMARWLVDHGYQPAEVVEAPGEFSRRGGILDVFSPDAEAPHRVEFFGDGVESLRHFSPQTQRSLGQVDQVEWIGFSTPSRDLEGVPNGRVAAPLTGHLCDFLLEGSWTVLVEADELDEQGRHYHDRVVNGTGLFSTAGVFQQLLRFPSVKVSALPSPTVETLCHLRVESVERFSGDVAKVRDELDTAAGTDHVLVACHNEGEVKRLGEVLATGQLAQSDRLQLVIGHVRAGFRLITDSTSPERNRRVGRHTDGVALGVPAEEA